MLKALNLLVPPISRNLLLFCEFSSKMTKNVLVVLPPGAEEMELVISVDVLRRAGLSVTVGGLGTTDAIKCSRDVWIKPDKSLEDAAKDSFDCIVLPGGLGGAKAMSESALVGEILKKQQDQGKLIAAICAAPTVLAAHSIQTGKSLTSYPSVKDQFSAYNYIDDKNVVQDGELITSRGPGTAFDFALKIAEVLAGAEKAKEVAKGMLLA